eukprot:TRINITY_DN32244_c0_g1_i1.p1 TRINITY_DN32244_c0_g1~~TRINITY_DN32244_c0_g1_i1.p1  ORF type:complete len:308 (-),score=10.61 TRINITY_DN32244_c0_g1_i1:31-885(-)
MRSIIFANYIARDTKTIAATIDVEHSQVSGFLGNLTLNIWDCGGQEIYMESYFTSQRAHIFRNVAVLIYLFDITSSEVKAELRYYKSCVEALNEFSPTAKVFCLIHKTDLLPPEEIEKQFAARTAELEKLSKPLKITSYKTSIWDETLYKAWSSIVYSLIPNIDKLEKQLNKFCEVCQADEVVLFERATFLVISHALTKEHKDSHRFEKISNIIKQFKLSCSKSRAKFTSMKVSNSNYTGLLEMFTSNTYILVVLSDKSIKIATTLLNIKNGIPYFEKLIKKTT